jgi:prepilin-type N-terminal cleavage/methylation domain-containing protein
LPRSYSAFRLPPSTLRPRFGVTLIELLIVMLIISILAALILGVASVAGETAREQHTRHVVERLHTLLTDFYGTFKTRRVRLNPAVEIEIAKISNPAARGRALAEARLYALREMMLMEIPDRWSDVLLNAVPATPKGDGTEDLRPIYLDPTYLSANGRTPLAETYLRRYQTIAATNNPTGEALTDNQGAECLYMVIMLATADGEARTLFGENTIGDTDGDGAPEFVDGWGHPISFLRWAPGFESQIQLDANQLGTPNTNNATWTKAAASDHDPYDLFRVDQFAFRLVPLVFSGGRDEKLGIRPVKAPVAWIPTSTPPAGLMLSGWPRLSPYFAVTDASDNSSSFLGTPTADGTATDNIHNHLLGLR